MYDVAVVGGGIAGMATAARLQAQGVSTIVFEAHGHPGGCAGYFHRRGFSFDVGATTLVDFEPGGVGGELLESIGMAPLVGHRLRGYVAWLPDRRVTLYREPARWSAERLRVLGITTAHRRFWNLMDRLAAVFWSASRRGVKLPLSSFADVVSAFRAIGPCGLSLTRYLGWTMQDALAAHGLAGDRPLVGLLSMLVEDTVHNSISEAPLVNAALGITIRGAGLTRALGGMRGFWTALVKHYRGLGGELKVGCRVDWIRGHIGEYLIRTQRGDFVARHVVSALPAELTARIAPGAVTRRLQPYLERNRGNLGGAIVVFLGVPEIEVAQHEFTHHQLLHDYEAPLGNGNNMFISVSEPGDTVSAPPGHRAVMISTHCELEPWEGLSPPGYEAQKRAAGNRLISLARRVYPRLGSGAVVHEVGTPRTYERFTSRPRGAVGGFRQNLTNANQRAIPHNPGVPGFWMVGDSTWPGLGTVACVLGSRIVAERLILQIRRHARINTVRGSSARTTHAALAST